MKKIVIFGGGSGLSQLLKGLKLFPIDLTAIVSMSDNGKSTGMLRKDFNIPAVGDITKVMLSMSDADQDTIDLLNYRFHASSSIESHSIKNLMLTALLDIKGNCKDALKVLNKMLLVKGRVLPLTEDSVDLIGITDKGEEIVGEDELSHSDKKIVDVRYSKPIKVNSDVIKAIKNADLIIFSSGSLFTSIYPHIIAPDVVDAISKSKAKTMYICNLVTQPGETDNFKVSDHIKMLEKHLGVGGINIVLANGETINKEMAKKYATREQKDPVLIDENKLKKMNIELIKDNLISIENGFLRHDSLKVGYLIFSYLMDGE
jgi:uncharacterized cofD-like protein